MQLKQLHHFAWKCKDIDETIEFYTNVLGLPHVHTIEKDHVPSTGAYAPYKHIFFQLQDKSCIAFFDLGDGKGTVTDCDDWIVHFAFRVDTTMDVDNWYSHLTSHDVEVISPVNHDDWIYSIYFVDPNGLRLEITSNMKKKWEPFRDIGWV
jgi:catechol 2,3-dioxygenase-like lactoylglutathione lyase family enzyme